MFSHYFSAKSFSSRNQLERTMVVSCDSLYPSGVGVGFGASETNAKEMDLGVPAMKMTAGGNMCYGTSEIGVKDMDIIMPGVKRTNGQGCSFGGSEIGVKGMDLILPEVIGMVDYMATQSTPESKFSGRSVGRKLMCMLGGSCGSVRRNMFGYFGSACGSFTKVKPCEAALGLDETKLMFEKQEMKESNMAIKLESGIIPSNEFLQADEKLSKQKLEFDNCMSTMQQLISEGGFAKNGGLKLNADVVEMTITASNASHHPDGLSAATSRVLPSSVTISSMCTTSSHGEPKSSFIEMFQSVNGTRKHQLLSGSIAVITSYNRSTTLPVPQLAKSPLLSGSSSTESAALEKPMFSIVESEMLGASDNHFVSPALSMEISTAPQTQSVTVNISEVSAEGSALASCSSQILNSLDSQSLKNCGAQNSLKSSPCPLSALLDIVISIPSKCRVLSYEEDYTTDDEDDYGFLIHENDDIDSENSDDYSSEEDENDNCDYDEDGIIFADKKVRFAEETTLIPILNEEVWYHDYAEARINNWASDKARFQDKIKSVEREISTILSSLHRDRVYVQRFMSFEQPMAQPCLCRERRLPV